MVLLVSPVHKAPEELKGKAEESNINKSEETAKDGETVKDLNTAKEEAPKHEGDGEAWEAAKSKEQIKALELINKLKEIEAETTDLLSKLSKENGGRMEGLDFRLKSVESLTRKLGKDGINTPMNDVLRYTAIFDEGRLANGTKSIMEGLKNNGYQTVTVKNTFKEGASYKGINTNVKAPNGQVFEIQYHTPESFNMKQNINHVLYEQYRVLDPNSHEAIGIYEQMINNSKKINNPININLIK